MKSREWWEENAEYVKAWACYAMVMAAARLVQRLAFSSFFSSGEPIQGLRFRNPSLWANVAISVLIIAGSVFLFRCLVIHFVIEPKPWARDVHRHPTKPYIKAWLAHFVIMFAVGAAAVFADHQIHNVLTCSGAGDALTRYITWIFRNAVTYIASLYVFRGAIRKFVLPHAVQLPSQSQEFHQFLKQKEMDGLSDLIGDSDRARGSDRGK